jgi:hypothetical protein
VSGVEVHVHADRVELLHRVDDGRLVHRRRVRTLGHTLLKASVHVHLHLGQPSRTHHVRDKVAERVRLDDRDDRDRGERLDLGNDLVDVVLVEGCDGVSAASGWMQDIDKPAPLLAMENSPFDE